MKISLYFIFYIAMILELLLFILERDEATEQHVQDLQQMHTLADSLAGEFSKPLQLNVPPVTNTFAFGSALQRVIGQMGESTRVVVSPIGLWSDLERQSVEYVVNDAGGRTVYREGGVTEEMGCVVNRATGNAVFSKVFDREGEYTYTVVSRVRRAVPGYYPSIVRDSVQAKLQRRLGDGLWVSTDRAYPFTVVVKTEGQRLPPCEYCGQGPYRASRTGR
jgi:hypothetical protein